MRRFNVVQIFNQKHLENTVFCFISDSDDILHFALLKTNVIGDWTAKALISTLLF